MEQANRTSGGRAHKSDLVWRRIGAVVYEQNLRIDAAQRPIETRDQRLHVAHFVACGHDDGERAMDQ